jgi:hypothetical protein
MTLEERRSWALLAVAVAAYGVYLTTVLARAASVPLDRVDYVPVLLWSVGVAIVAGILISVALGMVAPKREWKKDVRDRDIALAGDRVGQAFLVLGGVAALLLAIVEAPHFYIANVVYLCFVLSSVVGSVTRVVVYRRGF